VEVIGEATDRQVCVPVTEQSQPAAARRAAVWLAQEAGIDEATIGNIALVVTELATNLVKHAQGGELLIRRVGPEGLKCCHLIRARACRMSAVRWKTGFRLPAVLVRDWALSFELPGSLMSTHSRAREPPLWRE